MPHKKKPLSQQEFLRNAMAQLGMTRQQFADRIHASKRRLDSWLLPLESKEFRELDPTIWQFIREMLNNRYTHLNPTDIAKKLG